MPDRAALLQEIETLPVACLDETFSFLVDIKQRHSLKNAKTEYSSDKEAYQAMAADNEREQEAQEWCNAYFGPIHDK